MPKIVPPPDPTEKEEPGAQIARWLGPVGGVFVLLLSALMVVFCFTAGANPVPGYTPPHDSAYYAGLLDELAQELNANFLPVLDETAHAEADGGTVTVTASAKEYVPSAVVVKVLAVPCVGIGLGASLGVSKSIGSENELLLLHAVTENAVAQINIIILWLWYFI